MTDMLSGIMTNNKKQGKWSKDMIKTYDTGLPKPLTARMLWHWAYYNGSDSIMYTATEIARLGAVGRAARWSETKTPSKPEAFSDNSRQVWIESKKQIVRGIINTLPADLQSLGNMLYLPEQDLKKLDITRSVNLVYQTAIKKVKREDAMKLQQIYDIALFRYWEAISAAIEGGTPKSMTISGSEARALFAFHGRNVDTRYWQREYADVWNLVINTIRVLDNRALAPLGEYLADHFQKIEDANKAMA